VKPVIYSACKCSINTILVSLASCDFIKWSYIFLCTMHFNLFKYIRFLLQNGQWTSCSGSNTLRLVFGICVAHVLAGTPIFLTEDFSSFPQSYQVNARLVPGHDHFLPNSFHFTIYLSSSTIPNPDTERIIKQPTILKMGFKNEHRENLIRLLQFTIIVLTKRGKFISLVSTNRIHI
jgi:hypothetical protein